MIIKLTGARVIDPQHDLNEAVRDLYLRDGKLAEPPRADERIDETFDVSGMIVMAGAIDLHTHIAGGKVNLSRALLPELAQDLIPSSDVTAACFGGPAPSTLAAGYRYAA